ncbi:MAG: FixH family protein [Arcobacteraceae bacterium]
MKKIILILMVMFTTSFLNADIIDQNGLKDGYNIKLYTKNTPITGNNEFFVTIAKDAKVVEDAKVKVKVFMPEMPGMPYMEYKAKAQLVDGEYKMMINFNMGGTWQYHLKFKTNDNKIHTVRGSVNI